MVRIRMPSIRTKKSSGKKPTLKSVIGRLKKGYITHHKKRASVEEGVSLEGISGQIVLPPWPYPVGHPPETKEKPVEKVEEYPGIEIPTEARPLAPIVSETTQVKEALKQVNIYYNLIPGQVEGKYLAYANIKWNPSTSELTYTIIEPPLGPGDKELIKDIKRELEQRLDIDFSKLGAIKSKELLREEIRDILSVIEGIDPSKISVLSYHVEKEVIGLGPIEPLMKDPNIEDISCDGRGVPIYIYHRDPRFASLKTNLVFDVHEDLDNFVLKLAQKCNKTISIAEPLLDGTLTDGSRVQATLGTDIARKGSNFTIRKFTETPLTPIHMLKFKTINSLELAYLWIAVENGQSILISGGTATGKTSLLNALSLFIPPSAKVVSIEDTSELRLPHPHWIPEVARNPIGIKNKVGEVTLFDLLKSSLRQRPDYIVLGEVRGREAFVLFQQMATGHPSLATIHAASMPQLIDRLITPPISLPPTLLENIDVIVFLVISKLKGVFIRRANTIEEVVGVKNNNPVTNKIFRWQPVSDSQLVLNKSTVLKKISERLGMTEEEVKEELIRRKIILDWMLGQEIIDYREVAKVITTYYTAPQRLIDLLAKSA